WPMLYCRRLCIRSYCFQQEITAVGRGVVGGHQPAGRLRRPTDIIITLFPAVHGSGRGPATRRKGGHGRCRMKRLGMLVAAGAGILTTAVPAKAQQPNFTVTFGGQMRVFGLVWDNMTDFADTNKVNPVQKQVGVTNGGGALTTSTANKDSESYYFQR